MNQTKHVLLSTFIQEEFLEQFVSVKIQKWQHLLLE